MATEQTLKGNAALATLLSQALVAFTIEFDNEAEHRLRHRTTRHGATGLRAPWLVSMAMWFNCMQFLGEEGMTLGELERRARTRTNLDGMRRWGYISIGESAKRVPRPRADMVIRATSGGCAAQEIWRPLAGEIEKRWEERFGKSRIEELKKALSGIESRFEIELPDCLPILGYGLFSGPELRSVSGAPRAAKEVEEKTEVRASGVKTPEKKAGVMSELKLRSSKNRTLSAACEGEPAPGTPGRGRASEELTLATLLSRVLLEFAMEFEAEMGLSLAIAANVLRVLDEEGKRLRDLPRLSGVSKEAISMAMGILRKRMLAAIESDPSSSRTKIVRLTAKGAEAKAEYLKMLGAIEARWRERFGKDAIAALRRALEPLVGDGTAEGSPLFGGLEPYPEGWRAKVGKPETLPHYPMVLHRGGYPDGS